MISLITDLTIGAAASLIALYVTTAAAIFVGARKRPLAASSTWTIVDQEEASPNTLFLHTVIIWNRSKKTLEDSDFIRKGRLTTKADSDEFIVSSIDDFHFKGIHYPKYDKQRFYFEYWQDGGWLVFRMSSNVANPGLNINFKDSGREIFWVTSDRFSIDGILISLFIKFGAVMVFIYPLFLLAALCFMSISFAGLNSLFAGLDSIFSFVVGSVVYVNLIWLLKPLRKFGRWLIFDTLDDVASVLCRPSARGLSAMNKVIREFGGSNRS